MDIIGTSETGSGKTAAFLLPVIQGWLNCGQPKGYALILAPTRELVFQIEETANRLMRDFSYSETQSDVFTVFRLIGGEDAVEQAINLAWCRHHVIVATPGRLVEHMKQSNGFAQHHLSTLKHLVLDEADRMLSMEFSEDLDTLLKAFERPIALLAPTKNLKKKAKLSLLDRVQQDQEVDSTNENVFASQKLRTKIPHPQTHLYTATMTKDVSKLRRAALNRDAVLCTTRAPNPDQLDRSVSVVVVDAAINRNQCGAEVNLPVGLSHFSLPVPRTDKLAVLDWLLHSAFEEADKEDFRVIVFCARCHEARYLAGFLRERGYAAAGLSGRLRQSERRRVLVEFSEGQTKVLVATDVASRGLDLPFVAMVINYGVPLTVKTYRHRVGRTARAGQTGVAVTILTRDDGLAYLELESALLPTAKGEERRSLPRWPKSLPSETKGGTASMFVRRRLAEEAWSRAAKALREEKRQRISDLMAAEETDSSASEDERRLMEANDNEDDEELANRHWASGAAGIEAARRAYAVSSRKKWSFRLKSDGLQDDKEEEEASNPEDDEADEGVNLHFSQPIKEKRAALSVAKKRKREAEKKSRRGIKAK